MKVTARWVLVVLLAGGTGCSIHRNAHIAPTADVEMDAKVLAKFQKEIEEYRELHQELVHRIPNVGPNATAEEIAAHRAKMTKGIQAERRTVKQGEIFKPRVETAFRRVIADELASPERAQVVNEIKQGNPTVENGSVWFCSDEHTTFAPEQPLQVGNRVRVTPAHIDPTVAYHERLHLVDGERVLETWPIDLRGW